MSVDPKDDLVALLAAEQAALLLRRHEVLGQAAAQKHPDALAVPRVGLALSGGGVRSATFALGLMRGMAQSGQGNNAKAVPPEDQTLASDGLLGRIDYLSTVSGGGYAGGMFGRLVATFGMAKAQCLMADASSPVLAWLRRNGRYLTPGGSRDLGIALVTYMRAVFAIHAEFMVACMLVGLVVVAPHLWQHSAQVLNPAGWERWMTPWWALSLVSWMTIAPGLISGYWAARDTSNPDIKGVRPGLGDVAFLIAAGLAAWWLVHWSVAAHTLDPWRDGLTLASAGVLALVSLVTGQGLVQGWLFLTQEPHALAVARVRNGLTIALKFVTLGAGAIAGLGALDVLSWWVLEEFQSGNGYLWGGVGLGGLLALALRTMVQPLQQMAAEAGGRAREWLPRLINVGGYVGLLLLVVGWLVLLQWFIFAPETFAPLINTPAWMRAAMVAAVWASWVVLTAGNAQMANTSSLHSFYRARLTRAYLAAGNARRELSGTASKKSNVTAVVDGDDIALREYRPECNGGPIHLVNTCLNQTRDDQSGLYNADRKGSAVTATWRGLEVGPDQFIAMDADHDGGTLGRWMAVSGAAASPGAGAYTTRGLALLLYFLGVRLGHWVKAPGDLVPLRWLSRWSWRYLPKPMMLAGEASATFFGVDRPWWYLSDGGHFENTAVYALLKRELDFIILSDGSCDPDYQFGDIENLVRKARIDFGAEIDFYSREEAGRLFSLAGADLTVLSPEEMANNHSCRGVLLARIRYRARPGLPRPEGTLLIVKPNLHNALDVDLLAYAQRNDDFPHESTGDQSFDEAQWESYHHLGEDFGKALHDTWLAQLPGWRSPAHHGIRVAARLRDPKEAEASKTEPLWRRAARATAIGTTLGVGASGTLLLSMWQMLDQVQRSEAESRTAARQLFTDVSKGLHNLDTNCPQVPEHVVTQAEVLLIDLRGSPTLNGLERAGVDRLAARIADECSKVQAAPAACPMAQQRVRNDLCTLALKPVSENTALNYWHPGASPNEQTLAANAVWGQLGRLTNVVMGGMPLKGVAKGPDDVPVKVAVEVPLKAASGPSPSVVVVRQGLVHPPVSVASAPPAVVASTAALPSRANGKADGGLSACRRATGVTTLYVQIYDEASRAAAGALRQSLQDKAGALVQVAPIENVTRTSQLRQQRRPASWPKPTFVLHEPSSRACALAMARSLGQPWVLPGDSEKVWIRAAPSTLNLRPGVIELWLPPLPEGNDSNF